MQAVSWNGPMGVFEWDNFSNGTMAVMTAVANSKGFSVVGGGDSVAALKRGGMQKDIDHVSTGGGASLELMRTAKGSKFWDLLDNQGGWVWLKTVDCGNWKLNYGLAETRAELDAMLVRPIT